MKIIVNILLGASFVLFFGGAPTLANQQDVISGTWKGTSICQQKNSSCNDEIVVCHITKATAPNTYRFVMNKIVNNAEVDMGVLDFIYDSAQNTLTCHSVTRYDGFWKFDINKNIMDGTLTVDKNLFRIIKLVKN